MPLFLIYSIVLFVLDTGRNRRNTLHYCCMGAIGLKRQEVRLKRAYRFVVGLFGLKDPLSDGELLHGQPNVLPIILAWLKYHYTSVSIYFYVVNFAETSVRQGK